MQSLSNTNCAILLPINAKKRQIYIATRFNTILETIDFIVVLTQID
jgi:hypothetical protein